MTTQFVAPITSKGQVTLPAAIRRRLELSAPGRVVFVVEDDGAVEIRAPRFPTIESLRGIAGTLPRPMEWDEMLQIAHEDALRDKLQD